MCDAIDLKILAGLFIEVILAAITVAYFVTGKKPK